MLDVGNWSLRGQIRSNTGQATIIALFVLMLTMMSAMASYQIFSLTRNTAEAQELSRLADETALVVNGALVDNCDLYLPAGQQFLQPISALGAGANKILEAGAILKGKLEVLSMTLVPVGGIPANNTDNGTIVRAVLDLKFKPQNQRALGAAQYHRTVELAVVVDDPDALGPNAPRVSASTPRCGGATTALATCAIWNLAAQPYVDPTYPSPPTRLPINSATNIVQLWDPSGNPPGLNAGNCNWQNVSRLSIYSMCNQAWALSPTNVTVQTACQKLRD